MRLPDPVVQHAAKSGKTDIKIKQDPSADARRRDREEIKRRTGDVDQELSRQRRVDSKRRKVEQDGFDPVCFLSLYYVFHCSLCCL